MSDGRLQNIRNCLSDLKEKNNTNLIMEFGIFEGYSLSEIIKFVRSNNMSNKIYGLDSFMGLVHNEGVWGKGQFASTFENTKTELLAVLGHIDDITLIDGPFSETLEPLKEKIKDQKIAFAHIDSDTNESCKEVLEFIKEFIDVGSYIVFDEWDGGENVAWETFVKKYEIAPDSFEQISLSENQMILRIARKHEDWNEHISDIKSNESSS